MWTLSAFLAQMSNNLEWLEATPLLCLLIHLSLASSLLYEADKFGFI
jgi:hypothetical protein